VVRSLKAACGLVVLTLALSGCGGGAASASSTSVSSSLTGSAVSNSPAPANSGTATLRWSAPTTNSDGTALTDLAGFYIYYGTTAGSLTNSITVGSPTASSYEITNLGSGTWYFAIAAYTNAGVVSPQSNIGSKTIT
jgi:type IV secretory pathway VirJ component